MDTSQKYIKMCEKAEEIQKGWKPQDGDFYSFNEQYGRPPHFYVYIEMEQFEGFSRGSAVWLPRQDQLMEMLDERYQPNVKKYYATHIDADTFQINIPYWLNVLPEYEAELETFEQFLLSLVMDRKYQKAWNNVKGEWNESIKQVR